MTTPAVSVIIPAFNARPWISESIESVLNQTHPPGEVLVVDDGSGDGTADLVSERFGGRVRLVRQENRGLPAARNTGLAEARGELIQLLDADDLLLPRKLEKQVALLRDAPLLDVVYSDFEYFSDGDPEERWPSGHGHPGAVTDPLLDLIGGNTIAVHAALSRRARIEQVGGFDESLGACEDLDLWLRMAAAGCRFRFMPEVLARYRVRPASMSRDEVRQVRWTIEVLTRTRERDLPPHGRRALRRSLRRFRDMLVLAQLRNGLTLLRQGRFRPAAASVTRALGTDPLGTPRRIGRFLSRLLPGRPR